MTIDDHAATPTPRERRKVRFGATRQIVIAAGAAAAALIGLLVFAT